MKYFTLFLVVFINSQSFSQNVLNTYTEKELKEDYDLMVSSLKEAHPGLYWYTNYHEFENIFQINKDKIKEGMNSYEFYRLLSLVTTADKEGHSNISASSDIGKFFSKQSKFLPFAIKVINQKIYVLNDLNNKNTKGYVITEVNQTPIDTVVQKIFSHISIHSDGYTKTGKYKAIERFGFTSYYTDYLWNFKDDSCEIKIQDPKTNNIETLNLTLVDRKGLVEIAKRTIKPHKKKSNLFELTTNSSTKTSVLAFNSFDYYSYKDKKLDFRKVVDSLFQSIEKNKTKDLIIDIRNNEGGFEGAEDYLFSYLTKEPYQKYKYVEASAFSYSFIEHTYYKDSPEQLYDMLADEHYLSYDGRILRKEGVLPTAPPQKKIYKGNVYVLISGKTYSGGSEFAAIAKQHSNAIFIGEETGGGFYGQTSGSYINLILPNTKLEVRIPLLKFATNFGNSDIPMGRGVIPDYKVEQSYNDYINGIDKEMEFTLKLIENKK